MKQSQEKIGQNETQSKYTLDISQEELVQVYTKEWVLDWVEKYHPEVFTKARKFVSELFGEPKDEKK